MIFVKFTHRNMIFLLRSLINSNYFHTRKGRELKLTLNYDLILSYIVFYLIIFWKRCGVKMTMLFWNKESKISWQNKTHSLCHYHSYFQIMLWYIPPFKKYIFQLYWGCCINKKNRVLLLEHKDRVHPSKDEA